MLANVQNADDGGVLKLHQGPVLLGETFEKRGVFQSRLLGNLYDGRQFQLQIVRPKDNRHAPLTELLADQKPPSFQGLTDPCRCERGHSITLIIGGKQYVD
jgi:hypothetical protein